MRVTKPDGVIVLAFPIATGLECTYEDEKIHSVKERKKKFGQKDHVRLYGMDYKRRLEKSGNTGISPENDLRGRTNTENVVNT